MPSVKRTPPDYSQSCSDARTSSWRTPTNVDVDGIAVAVANAISNICLRILITWSDEDIDQGVQASLLQTLSVLLSTLASVNRNQLSIFDGNFALLLSSSPLAIYLVVATYCELCGMKTGLYKRIKHRRFISIVQASTPLLWLVLSMLLRLSGSAFIDSDLCEGSPFSSWLQDIAGFLVTSLQLGWFPPFFDPLFSIILILIVWRRWSQVMSEVRSSLRGGSKPWRWFYASWVFVKRLWYVIDHNHRWYIYLVFAYLDASWAFSIIFMAAYSASGSVYVLSFGQILSLSAAVPPFASTIKFIHSRRLNFLRFIRCLPNLALAEVKYLVLGREPDRSVRSSGSPVTRPNSPSSVPQELCPEEFTKPADSTAGPSEADLTAVVEEPRDTTGAGHASPTTVASNTSTTAIFPTVRRPRRSQTCPSLTTGVATVGEELTEPSSPPFIV